MDIETTFGEGSYLLPRFVLVITISFNIAIINSIIVVTIFIISKLHPAGVRGFESVEVITTTFDR